MSTYQKMTGHVFNPYSGSINAINMQLTIDGTVWMVPRSLIEVGDNMVISPAADVVDGDIRFRLGKWEIFQLYPIVVLPMWTLTQAGAVAVARAFEADPTISFRHSPEALAEWVNAYIEARSQGDTR